MRDLIGKGETLRSYRYYYRHRYTLDFMPLHNVFFAGIVVVVLSLLNGDEVVAAVQLGLLFHLLCDMVDNVRTQGLRYIVDFWILNPLLVLMGRTREQGARR